MAAILRLVLIIIADSFIIHSEMDDDVPRDVQPGVQSTREMTPIAQHEHAMAVVNVLTLIDLERKSDQMLDVHRFQPNILHGLKTVERLDKITGNLRFLAPIVR